MNESEAAARVAYEMLLRHGDLSNCEAHKEILRTLSAVNVDYESAAVLQRLHGTEFGL